MAVSATACSQPQRPPPDSFHTSSFLLWGLGLVRGTRVGHSPGRPGRAARLGQDWRPVSCSITGAGTDGPRLGWKGVLGRG